MSGIFGILDSRHKTPITQLLAHMGSAMSHRDWYVVETCTDENAGVGLGRIGIGIFNREHQPLYSEDGTLEVFFRGELYETTQSRQALLEKGYQLRDDSDSELVLRLYQDRGDQFIHHIEGAFGLAIWNSAQHELTIANDRAGLYPLLYAHYDGKFVFAPELKGILCDPAFRKELDLVALAEYIRFQHLLGDKTFFTGLALLPNASILHYDLQSDTLAIRPYWSLAQLPQLEPTLTFEEAVEEAGRLLKAAVHRLSHGSYRLGVYLSGGMDSRVILGLIDPDRCPVTTVTYGQPNCRDMLYARQIARAAGARHYAYEFPDGQWVPEFAGLHLELTEGFHSWIHAHGISILNQVRPLLDVNLTGLHGAELNWDNASLYEAQDDLAFACRLFEQLVQHTTWPSLNDAEERLLFSPRLAPHMRGLAFDSLRSETAKCNSLPYWQQAAFWSCNTDRRLYQYYTVFHRSHVEQRFPFYDYRYFEFIHALPPAMLFERKLRRAVISRMTPTLASIPYDRDELPITRDGLPRAVAKLAHQGKKYIGRHIGSSVDRPILDADYENWLRAELRAWGENLLLGKQMLQRDLFDPQFLESLWRRHQSGLEANFIGKIAPLMTLEMLLRRFYDA